MFEDCVLRDRALYVPNERTLVLADVHLGRDRASNVQLPLGERRDLLDRLEALLERFEPNEVVVAGDLLHSFDRLPRAVERNLHEIEALLDAAGARLVVTRGNHDSMLESVFESVAEYAVGDVLVCHGHERPRNETDAAGYVIGHVHPAITIEGRKRPCYLRGPTEGREILVLPAFTRLAGGVDVARARSLRSPLLGPPNDYRPVVRDEASDETLSFPPLGEFRSLL